MPQTDTQQLGRFVREHRHRQKLTLRALAKAAGLDHTTVYRIERGEFGQPAPEKLKRLAAGLNIPAEDLYALAGYTISDRLPDFAPYLRAKYDLPERAVHQLEEYFDLLREKFGGPGDKGDGNRSG